MLIELYIFFEIVMLILFGFSFFTKQELLWGLTVVLSAILMFTSWGIETKGYEFNNVSFGYDLVTTSTSYPYMMGINLLFFVVAVILALFDIFDKYKNE